MNPSHDKQFWLDEWFPLLLIAFGILFVSCLLLYNPTNAGSPGGSFLSSSESSAHQSDTGGPGNR